MTRKSWQPWFADRVEYQRERAKPRTMGFDAFNGSRFGIGGTTVKRDKDGDSAVVR